MDDVVHSQIWSILVSLIFQCKTLVCIAIQTPSLNILKSYLITYERHSILFCYWGWKSASELLQCSTFGGLHIAVMLQQQKLGAVLQVYLCNEIDCKNVCFNSYTDIHSSFKRGHDVLVTWSWAATMHLKDLT